MFSDAMGQGVFAPRTEARRLETAPGPYSGTPTVERTMRDIITPHPGRVESVNNTYTGWILSSREELTVCSPTRCHAVVTYTCLRPYVGAGAMRPCTRLPVHRFCLCLL